MKKVNLILQFTFGFILTLSILELYLRFAEIESLSAHTYDLTLGTKVVPDRKLIFFNEGFYMGNTNKYGYFGPNYPPQRSNNSFRIALLGDSYVEGFQLFDRNHFRSLIEKKLDKVLDKDVEVMNFGMSGFSLEDEYCYYTNFVHKFDPDVLLFFLSLSDLNTNRKSSDKPYCYLENDSLKISYNFRNSDSFLFKEKTSFLRGKVTIFKTLNNCMELVKEGMLLPILFDKLYWGNKRENKEDADIKVNNSSLSKETIAIINALPKEKTYFVLKENLPDNIINSLLQLGVKIINPNPSLETLKKNGIDPKFWKATNKNGHWNAAAHAVVSDVIVNELKIYL